MSAVADVAVRGFASPGASTQMRASPPLRIFSTRWALRLESARERGYAVCLPASRREDLWRALR